MSRETAEAEYLEAKYECEVARRVLWHVSTNPEFTHSEYCNYSLAYDEAKARLRRAKAEYSKYTDEQF